MRILGIMVMTMFLGTGMAGAATIHLNNGNSVQGDIVKQDAKSMQINVDGVTMTYYADEIKDVDGQPFAAAAPSAQPEAAAQPDTTTPSDTNTDQTAGDTTAAQPEAAPAPAPADQGTGDTTTAQPDTNTDQGTNTDQAAGDTNAAPSDAAAPADQGTGDMNATQPDTNADQGTADTNATQPDTNADQAAAPADQGTNADQAAGDTTAAQPDNGTTAQPDTTTPSDTTASTEAPATGGTGDIDPEKRALILKFIDVFGTRQALTNNFDLMIQQIEKEKPDEAQKIRQRVKIDEIIERLLPIYDRNFTTDDLKSFIAFYGSAEGQKLITTIPELMKESVQESVKYMEEKFPEVKQGQQQQ